MTPTDQRYEATQELGIPPYMWYPPETPPLLPTNNPRDGFPADDKTADDFKSFCSGLKVKHRESGPNQEQPGPGHGRLERIPHPFSDFSHVHPEDLSHVPKDGPQAVAFQRLQLAFDWIMCRAHEALWNLNQAVLVGKPDYATARREYLDFIRNLDNHEPQEAKGQVDPAKCLGYGKVIKWVYIDPIVQAHPTRSGVNVIVGATIVLEWNPHSSSSGIPIPHK